VAPAATPATQTRSAAGASPGRSPARGPAHVASNCLLAELVCVSALATAAGFSPELLWVWMRGVNGLTAFLVPVILVQKYNDIHAGILVHGAHNDLSEAVQ